MAVNSESDQEHRILARRLESSFKSIYLTMLSIIQGVVLAVLAADVFGGYKQFTIVEWTLIPTTFAIFVVIWYQLSMDVAIWEWILGFGDSIVPFIIGAVELALAYSISLVATFGIRMWLWANTASAVMGVLGILRSGRRALQDEKNRQAYLRLVRLQRFRRAYMLVTAVATFVLAAGSFAQHLDTADGVGRPETTMALTHIQCTPLANLARRWAGVAAYRPGNGAGTPMRVTVQAEPESRRQPVYERGVHW
jgi:hypothetical protein